MPPLPDKQREIINQYSYLFCSWGDGASEGRGWCGQQTAVLPWAAATDHVTWSHHPPWRSSSCGHPAEVYRVQTHSASSPWKEVNHNVSLSISLIAVNTPERFYVKGKKWRNVLQFFSKLCHTYLFRSSPWTRYFGCSLSMFASFENARHCQRTPSCTTCEPTSNSHWYHISSNIFDRLYDILLLRKMSQKITLHIIRSMVNFRLLAGGVLVHQWPLN